MTDTRQIETVEDLAKRLEELVDDLPPGSVTIEDVALLRDAAKYLRLAGRRVMEQQILLDGYEVANRHA